MGFPRVRNTGTSFWSIDVPWNIIIMKSPERWSSCNQNKHGPILMSVPPKPNNFKWTSENRYLLLFHFLIFEFSSPQGLSSVCSRKHQAIHLEETEKPLHASVQGLEVTLQKRFFWLLDYWISYFALWNKLLACREKNNLKWKNNSTERKFWKERESIFTFPWQSRRVATKGSSATSFPMTRKVAADTTCELHNKKLFIGQLPITLACLVLAFVFARRLL